MQLNIATVNVKKDIQTCLGMNQLYISHFNNQEQINGNFLKIISFYSMSSDNNKMTYSYTSPIMLPLYCGIH